MNVNLEMAAAYFLNAPKPGVPGIAIMYGQALSKAWRDGCNCTCPRCNQPVNRRRPQPDQEDAEVHG